MVLRKLQVTAHQMSRALVVNARTHLKQFVFLLQTSNLTWCPNFSSPPIFSSPIILGVIITKGNHDRVFMEWPKHSSLERVKHSHGTKPTHPTSFPEMILGTTSSLPTSSCELTYICQVRRCVLFSLLYIHTGSYWTESIMNLLFLSTRS